MLEERGEEESVELGSVGSDSTGERSSFIEFSDKTRGILGGVNVTWSKCLRCTVLSSRSMIFRRRCPILLITNPWLGRLSFPL